ncbi:MAG: hypothetical protein ACJASO_000931 [Cyclobacteriaceae bacterium]|jgi:hypothetical protein
MKTVCYTLLTLICLSYGCTDDEPSATELAARVDQLTVEISEIVESSTGETSDDCRTTYIPGGNSCGPIYVYGVLGIDTIALENLFDELSIVQTDLYNLEGGPVCFLLFPAKDSLINGTCKACYGSEANYECF